MSCMEKLIAAIREAVDRGDVTMSGLARDAECTRQHLYGVLEGKHHLSLHKAEKLANAIGMELVYKRSRKKTPAETVRST